MNVCVMRTDMFHYLAFLPTSSSPQLIAERWWWGGGYFSTGNISFISEDRALIIIVNIYRNSCIVYFKNNFSVTLIIISKAFHFLSIHQ